MAQPLPSSGPAMPGHVIGGRFRIEREVGVGGMGAVYAAIDLTNGQLVALKLMREELAFDERAVERFRREGAALAAIDHPAVVQIRDVGELPDGSLFLAMELLEGETLAARLERVGVLAPAELLPMVRAICDALTAAHTGGVIHRDIKPSNVHIPDPSKESISPSRSEAGGRERDPASPVAREGAEPPPECRVKLVDFGIARVRGFSKVTSSGLAVGTVRYMSPEQLMSSAVDERADLYALGVVMYEALAGEHPFERTAGEDLIGAILVGRVTPLSSLRPDLPPAVTQVVHRAMSRLPTDRFASAAELARALERAVQRPDADPFDSVEAPMTRVRVPDPIAIAPTIAAPSVRPPATYVRPKRKKPYVALLVMLIPIAIAGCAVTALGGWGLAGCQSYLTDIQLKDGIRKLRTALAEHESLAGHRASLHRFEEMRSREEIGFLAATAFNARVTHVTKEDDHLDDTEAVWLMQIVDDIIERRGDYDVEQYSKMTQGIDN